MISIIDTVRFKEEHLIFNSAFVDLILTDNSNKRISLYMQKDHLALVKGKLSKYHSNIKNLEFKTVIGLSNKKGTIINLLSIIVSVWNDLKIFINSKDENMIFTSINVISFLNIKFLNLFTKKNIYFVIHGELEYLLKGNDKQYRFIPKILRHLYRRVFWQFINEHNKYIILGESIMSNLTVEFPKIKFKKKCIYIIDHPYFYDDIEINKEFNPQIISLGIVGHADISKGSHNIFKFADYFKFNPIKNDFKFYLIGHLTPNVRHYSNGLVEIIGDSEFLSETKYRKAIFNLDYIIFFYEEELYRFIASGAFFDAINFEIPIIALKNSYFKYYFDKFGEIGYLCENLAEMIECIKFIDVKIYNIHKNNIKKQRIN